MLVHISSSRNVHMVSLHNCPHSILNGGPHSMLIRSNSNSSSLHSMLMNSRSRYGMETRAPVMLLRAGMGIMGIQRWRWVGGVSR